MMMPPDVRLGEKGMGATIWPRDDWGSEARADIETITREILEGRGAVVSVFQPDTADPVVVDELVDHQQRIARELGDNPRIAAWRAPVFGATKLTLGGKVASLRGPGDADRALFISLRDEYTGTQRVIGYAAVGVLTAAAFIFLGVPPVALADLGGGRSPSSSPSRLAADPSDCPEQSGYASMVDLASGDVVWFNRIDGGCSDLRDRDELHQTLDLLLTGIP